MAERTLTENVAQAKADFKAIRRAVVSAIPKGTPTSEYGERIQSEIMFLQQQADSQYNYGLEAGIEQGRAEGLEQGIEQGKQEAISNSKYIEKTASGKVIRLDDVSEVAHKVVVKADTPTEVKVYGKNLFNNDISLLKEVTFTGSSGTQSTRVGYEICGLPSGTYTFTLKTLNNADKFVYGLINDKDGNFVAPCSLLAQQASSTTNHTPLTITVNEGDKIYIYNGIATSVTNTIKVFENVQIQLSAYSTGGDYEEYQCQTITATPEGTEIPSICPTMTFLAENDITVDYYGSYSKHEWWGKYLNNGKVQPSNMIFAGVGWKDTVFDPLFDINMSNSSSAFNSSGITDLRGILQKNGVSLIFNDSNTSYNQHFSVFTYSKIKYIPYLKLPLTSVAYGWFTNCAQLIEVDGYECTEKHTFEASSGANKTFQGCHNLVHIIFHGVIANTINMQDCKKLYLESLISLFMRLADFRYSDNIYTKTITLSSESWALTETQEFMDAMLTDGKNYAYNIGWNYA